MSLSEELGCPTAHTSNFEMHRAAWALLACKGATCWNRQSIVSIKGLSQLPFACLHSLAQGTGWEHRITLGKGGSGAPN